MRHTDKKSHINNITLQHPLTSPWTIPVLLTLSLLIISLVSCQTDDDTTQEESASNHTTSATSYSPPIGYAASSQDPLAALYGGAVKTASTSQKSSGLNDKALQSRFSTLNAVPLDYEFPRHWRLALKKLEADIPLKITAWKSRTTTRMEKGQRDREVSFTLKLLGSKNKIHRLPSQRLRKLKEFKTLPSHLGDEHEHRSERGNQRVTLSYKAIKSSVNKANPLLLATLQLTWTLKTPPPPQS